MSVLSMLEKRYLALLRWCNYVMKIYPDKKMFLGSQNKILASKIVPPKQIVRTYHYSDIAEKHAIPSRTGQYYSYNEILKRNENKRNDILASFVI